MLTQRPVSIGQWMRNVERNLRRLDGRVARLGSVTAHPDNMLVPSYTTAERTGLFAEVSMIVYDSDLGKLVLFNGAAWVNVDGTVL